MARIEIPSYRLRDPEGRLLLDTPAMTLPRGGIMAVTGPSGAGKSLWLHSLFGWAAEDARQPAALSPANGAYLMVQDPSRGLTPGLSLTGHFDEVCRNTAARDALLERLGFPDPAVLRRRPETFSGGERQRLMLALLLIRNPAVLVCDEPMASLDAAAESALWHELIRHRAEGTTLVFITHALHLIEAFADTVLLLDGGRPVFFGSRDAFFQSPTEPVHARLLDSYRESRRPHTDDLPTGPPLLQMTDISLAYDDQVVLDGYHLTMQRGEWLWVTGPSGAGKTSMMRVAAGLTVPDAGTLSLLGAPAPTDLRRRSPEQKRALQFLFQHGSQSLNPARTVATQLREAIPDADRRARLTARLHLAGLDLNRPPGVFSLGELQRLNLMRALGRRPALLIGDELLTSLDLNTRAEMLETLAAYRAETGAGIMLSTHDTALLQQIPGRNLRLGTAPPNG